MITAASAAGICFVASIVLHLRKSTDLGDYIKLDDIPDEYDANDPRIAAIGERICHTFQSASHGKEIEALNRLFRKALSCSAKFLILAETILRNCDLTLLEALDILESIKWPGKLKEEKLATILAVLIADTACMAEENTTTTILGNDCPINLITVDLSKILGDINLFDRPNELSESLSVAMGYAIQWAKKEFKDKSLGTALIFDQNHCKFPPSFLKPVLPYLSDLNLVTLKLRSERQAVQSNLTKFTDEHFDSLIKVITDNPYMIELKLNLEGMSFDKQQAINQALIENTSRFSE